ncbi:MAG: rod shape-determining protein RodA [Bdellovibrionales bacterium]|nr:rod shape-determining protein RodA [Bdellovibrionales bacterium]
MTSAIRVDRRVLSNFDWLLTGAMLLLCAVGLVVLFSAGHVRETNYSPTMERQFVSMSIGLGVFVICFLLNPTFLRRWSFALYLLGCVLLAALFFKGVYAGGARRWLALGGFRFQPSEFMKLALILAMARIFSAENAPKDGYNMKTLITPVLVMGVPVALILFEPDLGTALCHLLIAGSMLLLAGVRGSTFLKLAIAGIALAYPAWSTLKDYQKQRVVSFLSPEQDPLGSGYHAIQSKIAVGSGKVFGKGFLEGTQTQLSFLPEQTTDFIFSVLAEEWGFMGSFLVISLFAFLVLHSFAIAGRCRERFSAFVVVGVAMMIFWHMVVNIGMVTGVLPVVGLTLPLLSYGGSSVITFMAGLGLVAGVSMRRFLFT